MCIKLTEAEQAKKNKGMCIVPYCGKKHVKQMNICWAHKNKRFREKHPEKYCYMNWQGNCRRRKKVNTVTFPQFLVFLKENPDYMNKKGCKVKSLQIDRDRECNENCPKEWCHEHGYHAHTIKAVTLREN